MRTFAAVRARTSPLLPLLLVGSAVLAEEPAPAYDQSGPVVTSVRIEGAQALSEGEILDGIATRGTGWLPWSTVHRLDRIALTNDVRRIRNFYRLNGYFAARVRESVEVTGRDRVRVTIFIDEGPPTRIERLRFTGLDEVEDEVRAAVREGLPLARGDVLRASEYEAARALVEFRLRRHGHAHATVEGEVDVHPDRREAEVRFTAAPGPVYRYGNLEIGELPVFPPQKVHAAVRRMLPRGERYSPLAMEAARGRVFELGAFAGARIELAEREDENPSSATVVVDLDERPANTIGLGGGAGIQQNLQQLQAIANYQNVNFLGGLRRLEWRNELAVLFLPTFLRPVRRGLGAETTLELTEPEIFARTDLAIRTGFQRVFRQAFSANGLTGRTGLPVVLARRSRITPAFNYERYFDFSTRQPVGPTPLPLTPECPAPCALAFPSLNLSHDRRDDPISPRSGYMLLGDFQYGFSGLGANFDFLRFTPEVRGYFPLTRSVTVAARARVGALWTLGGSPSPLVQRFFGGGDGGHRGFGAEQLSPIFEDADGQFVPLGGNGLWLTTVEARWRLGANWGVVLFGDLGNVTVDPLDFDLSSAFVATGLGLRYYTLAGPVRIDVAYRADRRSRVALDSGVEADTGLLDFFTLFVSLGESF